MENIDETTPIILLHGADGRSWSLRPIKKTLEEKYNCVHIVDYDHKGTLDQCLEDADKQIQNIVPKNRKIVIIGQSLGGVIGSKLHTSGWDICLLIAIASPLRGARFINTLNSKLSPIYTRFIRRVVYDDLGENVHKEFVKPPHPVYTISTSLPIIGNFDMCVFVDETIVDENTHYHIPNSHHALVFFSDRLKKILKEIL